MVSQSPLRYAPDLEALTGRAVDLMWNVYPGYSADLFDKDELIPSVRGNLALAVEVLRRDQAPSYRELGDGRNLGSRRASQSVPLESVIQAYRSTERVILLDLFSDSREWPVHQASHYADLIISTFDLLTDETINSYRETSSAIDAARRRTENEIVNSLASGYQVSAAEFEQWSRLLEINPTAPWFAFALLADAEADELGLQRLRRRLAVQLQPHVWQALFGDVGRATVVLVSPRNAPSETKRVLGSVLSAFDIETRIFCGTGQISENLASASESCQQALEAARAAAAHTGGRAASVIDYEDALVEILLCGRPAVSDSLVASRLEPLVDHPHLLQTLEALIANDLSQSRTARELFVHVNTVNHRVKRIREITGKDAMKVSDVLEMALALRWMKIKALSDTSRGARSPGLKEQ
jgi:sugar diacid utilization regulator